MKKLLAIILIVAALAPCTAGAASEYSLEKGSQCEAVVALQLALAQKGHLDEKYITGYFGGKTEDALKKYQSKQGVKADGVAGDATLSLLLGESYVDFFAIELERNEIQAFDYEAIAATPEPSPTPAPSANSATAKSSTVPKATPKPDLTVLSNEQFASVPSPSAQTSEQSSSVDDRETGVYFLGMTSDFVKVIQECLVNLGYLSLSKTTTYFGEMTEKAVANFQSANGLAPSGIVDDSTLAVMVSSSAKRASGAPVGSGSSSNSSNSASNSGSANIGSGLQVSGTDIASKATSFALDQMGKPYKYNTRGPDSFDCSGLVYYAYKSAGLTLPTSSSAQSQHEKGMTISNIYDLKVGDIVFFNTGNSYVAINHCGIYIGGGQFVHASSSAKSVIIRPLDSGFYLDAFRWALRVA